MKIVYAGTPEFAVQPLQRLIDAGYTVAGVITQMDKPQGRKGILTPPPVKTLAEKYGIPVIQPEKIRDSLDEVKSLGGDIMLTCAYGQILTQAVLDIFPKGVWNVHAGLLPKYRGASPIQSCILAGETQTGVSIMKTELGLDCGDVLLVEKTEILPNETYGELSNRLSLLGAELLLKALNALETGEYALTPQGEEGVQIVRKINKESARLSFDKGAQEVVNTVRAMNPAPVAYTECEGNKINVYRAEIASIPNEEWENAEVGEILSETPKKGFLVRCKDGVIKLTEVQAAGGKRMGGGDFLNGRKVRKGQILC